MASRGSAESTSRPPAREEQAPDRPAQAGLGINPLDGPADRAELVALLQALLLAAPEPPTIEELAIGAGADPAAVEDALNAVERQAHGWVVQRHGDRVQLATHPRFARYVRRFLGLDREARLSPAALETLAIVAYRQPVTRAEIEAVRGVDPTGVLATLQTRGLIEPVGRLPGIGHPVQYATTPEFLLRFGLRSLADLPALGEVGGRDAAAALDAALAATEESGRAGAG